VCGSEERTPTEVCAVHLDVCGVDVSRTNIDIDDDLVANTPVRTTTAAGSSGVGRGPTSPPTLDT
jgi:hypothetical protein